MGFFQGFGVLRFLTRDRRRGRRGRCASGFEKRDIYFSGVFRVVISDDVVGGSEAATAADIFFDFLLGAVALVEFVCIGVEPSREVDLGGRAVGWVRIRWCKDWERGWK